jgi:triacylglycerol esterase/lipase EstA (alpha/beta hydrolase family)
MPCLRLSPLAFVFVLWSACPEAAAGDYTVSGTIYWEGVGPVSNVTVDWYMLQTGAPFPNLVGSPRTDSTGFFQGRFNPPSSYRHTNLDATIRIPGQAFPIRVQAFCTDPYSPNMSVNIRIPRPLVLLHGVGGGTSTWSAVLADLKLYAPYPPNPPLPTLLIERPILTPALPAAGNGTHADNALALAATIDRYRTDVFKVLGRSPQPLDLDLAAHSSGGLVARAYIANHTGGPGQNTVRRCITVGSPHVGVVWLESLPPNHPVFALYPAVFQMRISYLILRFPGELKGGYGNTRFYLIGSTLNASPVEPESIVGWPYSKDDDGIVATYSATFPFPGGIIDATKNLPYTHFAFPSQKDVTLQIATWLN